MSRTRSKNKVRKILPEKIVKEKPLSNPEEIEKLFKDKNVKPFETAKSKMEKIEEESKLSKEEAILIAKTYVHHPVIYTPQTIKENKNDIIGRFLSSVEKLMK